MTSSGSGRSWTNSARNTLCLEFYQGHGKGKPYVAVVVSVGGRPGTFYREWGTADRALNEHESADFLSWVNLTIRHSYMARHGIQPPFELSDPSTAESDAWRSASGSAER